MSDGWESDLDNDPELGVTDPVHDIPPAPSTRLNQSPPESVCSDDGEFADCDAVSVNADGCAPALSVVNVNRKPDHGLSTIMEENESRPNSQIVKNQAEFNLLEHGDPNETILSSRSQSCASLVQSRSKAHSISNARTVDDSAEFKNGEEALLFLQEAEDKFAKDTPFILDDPRFNQTHFSKENSWEPSIIRPGDSPNAEINNDTAPDSAPISVSIGSKHESTPPSSKPIPARVAALREQPSQSRQQPRGNIGGRGGPVSSNAFNTSEISPPCHADSYLVNKQMSTPQAIVQGKRTNPMLLQKNLEDRFSDVSAIQAEQSVRVPAPNFDTSPVKASSSQRQRHRPDTMPNNVTVASNNTEGSMDISDFRRNLQDVPLEKIVNDGDALKRFLDTVRKSKHAREEKNRQKQLFPSDLLRGSVPSQPRHSQSITSQTSDTVQRVDVPSTNHYSGQESRGRIVEQKSSRPIERERDISLGTREQEPKRDMPPRPSSSSARNLDVSIGESNKENVRVLEQRADMSTTGSTNKYNDRSLRLDRHGSSSRSSLRTISQAGSTASSQTSNSEYTSHSKAAASLSTKSIYFGFIELGQSATKSLVVFNNTANELNVEVSLQRNKPYIQLVDASNGVNRVVIKGNGQHELKVKFMPAEVARYNDEMILKVYHKGERTSSRINIRGSGGSAKLDVTTKVGKFLATRDGSLSLRLSDPHSLELLLENKGKKPAFARIAVCDRNNKPLEVFFNPGDSIILNKRAKVNVKITVPELAADFDRGSIMGSRSSISSSASHSTSDWLYTVYIYWGEEQTRQRTKRWIRGRKPFIFANGGDFDKKFEGETPYDIPTDFRVTKEDEKLFESQIRSELIFVSNRASQSRTDYTMERVDVSIEDTMNHTVMATVIYDSADMTLVPSGSAERKSGSRLGASRH